MDAAAVEARDEGLHVPSGDRIWSESYYFNFCDRHGTPGGFVRLALHPACAGGDALVCVYAPPRGAGIALATGPVAQSEPGILQLGPLTVECVKPLEQWRIRFAGDVAFVADASEVPALAASGAPASRLRPAALDLTCTGLHAPFYYPSYRRVAEGPPHRRGNAGGPLGSIRRALRLPREVLLALRMRSGRHYEQSMAVRGTVTVDGIAAPLDGTGHRDHSWGLRDFGLMPRMRWLSGQMDGFAFNAVYITIAGAHVTNGYIWNGRRTLPADRVVLRNEFDESGLEARSVALELTAGGETFAIDGDVLTNVPMPIAGKGFSTMYTIGHTRYRCGERTGYGVAEFLERLHP